MDSNILDMKDEFYTLRKKAGLVVESDCSEEDNRRYAQMEKEGMALPKGVYRYGDFPDEDSEYYTVCEADLTEAQVREYLMLKQCRLLNTIKNCVMFFTILTIIGMVSAFLLMM